MALLYFRSSPKIEAEMRNEIGLSLKSKQDRAGKYSNHLKDAIKTRPTSMNILDYSRFRILHRRFEGFHVPGMAFFVGTSRKVLRFLLRPHKRGAK